MIGLPLFGALAASLAFFDRCSCQDFGYDGTEGPTYWGDKYANCTGKHQSPIDIEEDNVRIVNFPSMKFKNFDKHLGEVKIENNGHTVQLSIVNGTRPEISGGPLKDTYAFQQLHFHWGHNDTEGSENMINNHSFPLELHMVLYKKSYTTFDDALAHDDGLVVLSFLYSVVRENNPHYNEFETTLQEVHKFQEARRLPSFVSLDKFSTTHRGTYFTYLGSLTTPPCSEVVTWIDFKSTIPLSHEQIEAFRLLLNHNGQQLTHNFRPIQPLYDRVIYMHSGSGSLQVLSALLLACWLLLSLK